MSEKSASEEAAHSGEATSAPLAFEERIRHLATGYDNSQSVVRFVDTKAAATIGTVPIVLAILAGVFNWLQASWQWEPAVEIAGFCIVIAFLVSMLVVSTVLLYLAWRTVASAFLAIVPRSIEKTASSVLFPFEAADFPDRLRLFVEEPRESDAIEDYRRQLARMGEIVAIKIEHANRAILWLRRFFLASAIALGVMILAAAITASMAGWQYANESSKHTTAQLPQ